MESTENIRHNLFHDDVTGYWEIKTMRKVVNKQTKKVVKKIKILHIDKAGSGEAGGVWRSRYRNGWDVGENRTVQGGGRERTDIFAARGPTGHAAPATWRRTVIALVFLDYNSHADNWFAKGGTRPHYK